MLNIARDAKRTSHDQVDRDFIAEFAKSVHIRHFHLDSLLLYEVQEVRMEHQGMVSREVVVFEDREAKPFRANHAANNRSVAAREVRANDGRAVEKVRVILRVAKDVPAWLRAPFSLCSQDTASAQLGAVEVSNRSDVVVWCRGRSRDLRPEVAFDLAVHSVHEGLTYLGIIVNLRLKLDEVLEFIAGDRSLIGFDVDIRRGDCFRVEAICVGADSQKLSAWRVYLANPDGVSATADGTLIGLVAKSAQHEGRAKLFGEEWRPVFLDLCRNFCESSS